MEITVIIAIVAVIISGLTLVLSRVETGKIKSNCIATLTRDVADINKKLDNLKVDAVLERFEHIKGQLENGCERFAQFDSKVEKMHDEVLEMRIHTDAFLERTNRLYVRMDNFEIAVRKEIRDKGN